MKILHLNTFETKGGAARAAHRLHRALRDLEYDSRMFVAQKSSDDPTVQIWQPPKNLLYRLYRRLLKRTIARDFADYQTTRSPGHEMFSHHRHAQGIGLGRQLPPGDIIHLHWVANFIDYPSFFGKISDQKPVVWTLHDMNPLTGGCHYDNDCGKYLRQCGACPQLGSTQPNDLSQKIWRRKQQIFGQLQPDQLHIVALCRWMAHQVQNSPLLNKFPVTIIPNCLDITTFVPQNRCKVRQMLDIPQNAKVVLFVASSVTDRRKGFKLLTEALMGLDDISDLLLISIGSQKPEITSRFSHRHLGSIQKDQRLAQVYSAANVFVIPSLQDNLPNTVLEAMACGTPVVGFNVGGIPDMVRSSTTGLVVSPGDVRLLREAISYLLKDSTKQKGMSINCRHLVEKEYSPNVIADHYINLYRMITVSGEK